MMASLRTKFSYGSEMPRRWDLRSRGTRGEPTSKLGNLCFDIISVIDSKLNSVPLYLEPSQSCILLLTERQIN